MVVEADFYRVQIRFGQLFADPVIFEDQRNAVRRLLLSLQPAINPGAIYQITEDISPTNDSGKPPGISGTARYVHEGRVVRSEYFEDARVVLEYADFGSGLSPSDHERVWRRQKWARMSFSLEDFHKEHLSIDVPAISELYEMIQARADPSTLVEVEIPSTPDNLFRPVVCHIESRLKQLAEKQHYNLDLYVARDLLPEERKALEKRLTRPSTPSTIYILLSKPAGQPVL